MLLRFATGLLAVLLPLTAAAQRLAPASLAEAQRPLFDRLLSVEVNSGVAGGSNQVVPLWASPDGRLLAIVALSRGAGAPTLPPSPAFGGVSDLRIVDATELFSAGLRLRLGDSAYAGLTLGTEYSPRIAFGSDSGMDCSGCYAGIGNPVSPGMSSMGMELGWSTPFAKGLDFSFGLSWLDGQGSQLPLLADAGIGNAPIDLTLLDMPSASSYALHGGQRFAARGVWQLERGPMLDLTAALTRAELAPVWYGLAGPGLDLNQASLGLGLASGSLRGSIVGRVSSLQEPGVLGSKRWGGLDLGVSWRTPWRGEVTVGAQNLWSAPLDPASDGDKGASQARVPYVQYRQDL
jgi:hypothetical protein